MILAVVEFLAFVSLSYMLASLLLAIVLLIADYVKS